MFSADQLEVGMRVLKPEVATVLREPVPGAAELIRDIGTTFYRSFSKRWDVSMGACVAGACVIATALRRLGFEAHETPVILVRKLGDAQSLVVGDPEDQARPGHWVGHLTVVVGGLLIDPTFGQTRRDRFRLNADFMAAQILAPMTVLNQLGDLPKMAEIHAPDGAVQWFFNPKNEHWRRFPDADPERHRPVVDAIYSRFASRDLSILKRIGPVYRHGPNGETASIAS